MKNLSGTTLVVMLLSGYLGCGGQQSASTPESDSTSVNQAATTLSAMPPTQAPDSPDLVVAAFYNALRDGDASAIADLLTDKAREETARSGLDIRPQGSTSLSYELGEIDYITEQRDGAHVKSLWTETDADTGQSYTSEVIWVLRKQSNGWKIAGMATPVVDGQLPLLFNFEDPEDMLRKKHYIETEMADSYQTEVIEPPQGQDVLGQQGQQAAAPNDTQLR